MQKRKLGNTDLYLTTVGLGTWAQGGAGWAFSWGSQDDRESIAAIHRALDLGINWIDTAAVYGLGHAEEVLGRALEGRRGDAIVATKCGRVWDEGNPVPYARLKADSIRQECESSLRRLRIEVIDLYQVHWPQPEQDIEEAWSAIADLIREGKVRYAGVSNFSVDQIKRVQAIHPVASLQPPYSMLARGVEDALLTFCSDRNIGVITYSPMQNGLLSGKFTRGRVENLPGDDFRRGNAHFQEPEFTANMELVERLRPIAERSGHTLAQLSIAWVLRRPEVTSAIVGARRPSQIEETAPAADWELSEEDVAEIENLLQQRERHVAEATS